VVILLVEKNIWLDQWFSTWWWYTWNFQWSTGLLSRRLNMSFSSLSYVQYSFNQLSMTCQHSEVVHRIFLKTARGPTKVDNHCARFMCLWTMHTTTLLTSDIGFVRLMAILLSWPTMTPASITLSPCMSAKILSVRGWVHLSKLSANRPSFPNADIFILETKVSDWSYTVA